MILESKCYNCSWIEHPRCDPFSFPSSFELNCILMIELELIQYTCVVQLDLFLLSEWGNIINIWRGKNVNLISVLIFQCLFSWQVATTRSFTFHSHFGIVQSSQSYDFTLSFDLHAIIMILIYPRLVPRTTDRMKWIDDKIRNGCAFPNEK